MCVPRPEHTLRTLSTNRRGEGEAPPPAPSTYTPRRTHPAPARLTPGPYASVSAGGGGEKEARGRREKKTGGGKSKEEGRGGGGGRCGGGGGAGAGLMRTRRGRGAGPTRCRARGGREGRLAGWSPRSRVGGPLFPHIPPHLHPGEALNRHLGGGRRAGLSGFSSLTTPHVHGHPGLRAAARAAPFAPAPEGRWARVDRHDPFQAQFPKRG